MSDSYDEIISAQSNIQKMIEESNNSSFDVLIASNNLFPVKENASKTESFNISVKDVDNFIESVNNFMNEKEKLLEIRENILSSQIEESSSEISNCDKNNERRVWCEEITSHLQNIVAHNCLIGWYLQQPVVSNYLQMHHSYIDDLKELFEIFVNILVDFKSYSEYLKQTQLPDFEKSELCIYLLTQLLESIRETLANVNELNILIDR